MLGIGGIAVRKDFLVEFRPTRNAATCLLDVDHVERVFTEAPSNTFVISRDAKPKVRRNPARDSRLVPYHVYLIDYATTYFSG